MNDDEQPDDGVWFIYDGECPICNYAAHALRIRQSIGALHLVDARTQSDHPLVGEINALELDLDESMVLKYGGRYYRGPDGLELMALLGSPVGWFNRATAILFKNRTISRLLYPPMRAGRNLLIRMRGLQKIHNLERAHSIQPIFRKAFGNDWDRLPPVMLDHYANRPFTEDAVTIKGTLDIETSLYIRLLGPLLRISGALVPFDGKNVPVTVTFRSESDSPAYCFDRQFHFPGRKPYRFFSRMIPNGDDGEVIEYMRFGFGWRAHYRLEGQNIVISHRGYVLKIGKTLVPMPFSLLLGRASAVEETINETTFKMHVDLRHPLFGNIFAYDGEFEIDSVKRRG